MDKILPKIYITFIFRIKTTNSHKENRWTILIVIFHVHSFNTPAIFTVSIFQSVVALHASGGITAVEIFKLLSASLGASLESGAVT